MGTTNFYVPGRDLNVNPSKMPFNIKTEDSEKQSLKEICLTYAKAIADVTNRVPLQATKQENVSEEEFGNTSSWLFKKQTDKKNIPPESLFEEAAEACNDRAKSSHETTNKQQQNVAGLTGMAGIGKTTYCKFVLNNWIASHPHSFVFYISIRDVDFTKSLNILKFLLVSTDHDYKFKPKTDHAILDKINKSSDTLIVIDGLDEAEITGDFSKHPHGMSLYEKEKAYHILMNLLNCRLLPNAKKLIASRPNAFLKFNPECKPVFMLQVLGLSKESQNLLCKQYSKTEEQQKHVQDELEKQPNVSALLFIPIFARLIIPYFVDHLESNKPVLSISDVFLNQLKQWQKNLKFHTDLKHLKQLTKLAFNGVENRQFSFPSQDFVKHGIEMKSIEPFMCAHAKHQHGMLVLDGEKTFFFIHATWQEFLAALHLMVFASYEEFSSKIQQIFQQSSWEVVVRFLFGFCHQKVQEKLNTLFPDTQEINRKEKLVKAQARMLLPKLSELPSDIPSTAAKAYDDIIESFTQISEFESREKDSTLSNICSWANEAKDDDLTKAVVNSLPNPLLLSGDFLPHQVMSFCHVLSAAEESHILNVGDWQNRSIFTGLGLHTLLSTIQQSTHKVKTLNLFLTKKCYL
uniref:Uncharacterized protein LOC104265947 n=1 Tax=Phallusia mammillata TaxID=59560 RepID=A0A6F9DJ00_9ASCI|nr:uncharacterized protein LOC104265947 [Phallusia mammillata]